MSRFPTVFLDRDGTINVKAPEGAYITSPDGLELLPGAAAAVARLNSAGAHVVLITNQRGIARGLMSDRDYAAVHDRLIELLQRDGASVDAAYLCPHASGSCECRKPLPGMLLRAAAERPQIALERSVMIGDAESDVAAGRAAGTATVRIAPPGTVTAADVLVPDLTSAVDWVLKG
ncbi:MAG: HAD-IIIA family hydrolase [Actinomycetota bacterium]|nr:HAD-IIIA family hydrolase [Actinomycetota bacterium]